MPLPTPRLYATADDYSQYLGDGGVLPARLDYELRRASAVIDFAMTGAVYDTDDTGMPTETDVAEMMCQATCEQVEYQVELDDDTGAKARFDQVSISGVSMHRAPGMAGMALPPLGPAPMLTLMNAGALPTAPQSGR